MKYALVHISPPPSEGIEYQQQRNAFDGLLGKILLATQNQKDVSRLGESVWQIPLEHSLPILAAMFQGCQVQRLHIRVLFLEDPQWVSLDDVSK